jgi:membrane protease YdiL (CAAX protease family)
VSWLSAIPALGAMLSINYGYHWLLRQYIDSPLWTEELTEQFGWLSLIVICIQPAIVEEAYCRWFALDALQGVTGRNAAIWISATMFGLFHVAVLPSIPYLILFGVVLACLRLASGSLLLPIVVHLLHNLFILLRG